MNAAQVKQQSRNVVREMVEHLKLVASVISATAVIFGAVWWAFGDQIEPYRDLPAKIETVVGSVNELQDRVTGGFDEQAVRIKRVEDRVDEAIRPDIVEWDEFRSRVSPRECRAGSICSAELRVRRTAAGVSCDGPSAIRYIRDARGDVRIAGDPVSGNQASRHSTDWAISTVEFLIPAGTPPGRAAFWMELSYTGCAFLPAGQKKEERSPLLEFDIISSSR